MMLGALAVGAAVFGSILLAKRKRAEAVTYQVSALRIYPVKGCRGVDVTSAEINNVGFVNDRAWMVVLNSTKRFQSAREVPKMLLIEPSFDGSDLVLRNTADPASRPLRVPQIFSEEQKRSLLKYDVTVWDSTCQALDCGDEAAAWLTAATGQDVRLVTYGDNYERPLAPQGYYLRYPAPGRIDARVQTSFGDGFPFLVASEESATEVTRRTGVADALRRFRPNVVIRGCRPFEEDSWSELDIGDDRVKLFLVKPCARCAVPTIDPQTAEKGKEPTATMMTRGFRRLGNKPFFGQNGVQAKPGGIIRVGDTVRVAGRFGDYRGCIAADTYTIEPKDYPGNDI